MESEDLEFNRHCNAGFDLFTEILKVVELSRESLRSENLKESRGK